MKDRLKHPIFDERQRERKVTFLDCLDAAEELLGDSVPVHFHLYKLMFNLGDKRPRTGCVVRVYNQVDFSVCALNILSYLALSDEVFGRLDSSDEVDTSSRYRVIDTSSKNGDRHFTMLSDRKNFDCILFMSDADTSVGVVACFEPDGADSLKGLVDMVFPDKGVPPHDFSSVPHSDIDDALSRYKAKQ